MVKVTDPTMFVVLSTYNRHFKSFTIMFNLSNEYSLKNNNFQYLPLVEAAGGELLETRLQTNMTWRVLIRRHIPRVFGSHGSDWYIFTTEWYSTTEICEIDGACIISILACTWCNFLTSFRKMCGQMPADLVHL